MTAPDPDAVPEVLPHEFVEHYRRRDALGPAHGVKAVRASKLTDVREKRVWVYQEGGGFTDAVIRAAASARCTFENGFDVDDLIARAKAVPRRAPKVINEPGYKEPMLLCEKCGAWWRQSQSDGHRPDCSP